ncbi:alginate export family protein [bacterium]|nr:alginate export family protein [bacterium]
MKSKIWKVIAVVFAVALIAPAFSAVESVKVGGDINIYGVLRPNFKINSSYDETSANFFQTTARVYVTADLTDNVQAMIRLINERVWNCTGCSSELQVLLDLAYIKVTDLLTPGLTLTVGRQEIQLGEGLVVGSQYNAYGKVLGDKNNYVSVSYPFSTGANDLVLQKAFDAIRADYEVATVPVVITAFGAKIDEKSKSPSTSRPVSDTNLYGLNFEYRPDLYSLDVYYVRADKLHTDKNLDTAGLRVSGSIPAVEGLSLKLEYAKQFGEDGSDNDYEGWALLFGGSYEFPVDMKPVVRVAYNLFSGDDNGTSDKEYDNWQMVFPSNIASRIGPVYYAFSANNTASLTTESNLQVINLGFDLQPVEKVKLSLDGYWLKGDEDIKNNEDDIGYEVDLGINYQYTEDLSFGLTGGMLFTGDLFDKKNLDDDDNPWQVIASMKVAF